MLLGFTTTQKTHDHFQHLLKKANIEKKTNSEKKQSQIASSKKNALFFQK